MAPPRRAAVARPRSRLRTSVSPETRNSSERICQGPMASWQPAGPLYVPSCKARRSPMRAGGGPTEGFGASMRAHLELVEERNAAVLDEVAGRALKVIRSGGVLLAAGTGHSLAMVMETFYRAGGLACVKPVFHPGLLPLTGGFASSLLERTTGLAAVLAAQADARPGELAFVFSSSGANPVPVELARCLREGGVSVVAVTSLPHLRQAPARAGVKLDEVADLVIDTLVPPGDAAYH